jgi:hypothetical protein
MKKHMVCLFLVAAFFQKVNASAVLASSFGYNALDATSAFQSAIQSNNDTIIIDLQSANWFVGPSAFFNIMNKVIIFEPKVKLQAIAGAFNATDACLMRWVNCEQITLIGYQAEFKMNKAEYALLNDSEYRMSISLWHCKNVEVKGLTLNESGGDGIFIGGDSTDFCENIVIEDVRCINHYRQGMSICNAQNMTVRHCYFAKTKGTLPEAGIDVEPYQTSQRIVNLNIENCRFESNGYAGISLALFEMSNTSLDVSIVVKDCYFKKNVLPTNTYSHCEIFVSANDSVPVKGNVLFERCFIDGSDYSALYSRKTADAYLLTFKNCVFKDVSQLQTPYNEPIFLEVPDYNVPCNYLGGIQFDDVFISYTTNFNFFRIYGWSTLPGIKNINGNFTIVEPNNNPVFFTNVPTMVNVNYTFSNQTSLPSNLLSIAIAQSEAVECSGQMGLLSATRHSTNIAYPLGVSYDTIGSSVAFGDDIHLRTKGFIFTAGDSVATQSVSARNDFLLENMETMKLQLDTSTLYNLGANNQSQIQVIDCYSLGINESNTMSACNLYPNPTSDQLMLKTSATDMKIVAITDCIGNKMALPVTQNAQTFWLDCRALQSGIYFIRTNKQMLKFVKQ